MRIFERILRLKCFFTIIIVAVLSWTAAGDTLLIDPMPGRKLKWMRWGIPHNLSSTKYARIMEIKYGKRYVNGYAIIVSDHWSDIAPCILQKVPVSAARTYRFSGRVTVDRPSSIRFGIHYCLPDGDGNWRYESRCEKLLSLQPGTTEFSLIYSPPPQGKRCQLMPYVGPTSRKKEEKGRIRLEDLKLVEVPPEPLDGKKADGDRKPE